MRCGLFARGGPLAPAHCINRISRLASNSVEKPASLPRCATDALSGQRLDVVGTWHGGGMYAGFVYKMRALLMPGASGDSLWRGTSFDEPFWIEGHEGEPLLLPVEILDVVLRVPAPDRGYVLLHGQSPWGIELRQGLSPMPIEPLDVPMAGIVEWYISDESEEVTLVSYARALDQEPEELLRKRAVEFVAGAYSVETRRLIFAGTHINSAGFNCIGMGKYDCTVAGDGLSLEGLSLNHDGEWASLNSNNINNINNFFAK